MGTAMAEILGSETDSVELKLIDNGNLGEALGPPEKRQELAECTEKFVPNSTEDHDSTTDSSESDVEERGTWGHRAEFVLSLLGFSVGLANFWRFPYLCYRNGGGAFLIPYWTCMIVCGIPLYNLEVAIGQFCSSSAISIWKICPAFKGAGVATATIVLICNVYYMVLLAYVVYYFVASLTLGPLPWSSCKNPWNSDNCLDYSNRTVMQMYRVFREGPILNETSSNVSEFDYETVREIFENKTLKSPADEYFNNKLLQVSSGLTEPGGVVWPLVLCLIPVWIIMVLCLIKGVKSVGKVVYVTATFPYLMLTILLIRGLTLPGAYDGVLWYIRPNFTKLAEAQVWCDGAFQVFYSLGPGWGSIILMGSFNKFHTKFGKKLAWLVRAREEISDGRAMATVRFALRSHSHAIRNFLPGSYEPSEFSRDTILVPLAMGLTSMYAGFVVFIGAGFMSHSIGRPIEELVDKGPGVAFIMYPEVLAQLPFSFLWSMIFFVMLFTLGLDSQFVQVETGVMAIWDDLPERFKISRLKVLILAGVVSFLLGIPCVTQGGIYLIQIVDNYSSNYTAFLVCILELIGVTWIYGAENFLEDIYFMTGVRPNRKIWPPLWRFGTTGLLVVLICVAIVRYRPLTRYGTYIYPEWTIGFGWLFALTSLIWIPLLFVLAVQKTSGTTLLEKLIRSFQPSDDWGPAQLEDRVAWLEFKNESKKLGFFQRVRRSFVKP